MPDRASKCTQHILPSVDTHIWDAAQNRHQSCGRLFVQTGRKKKPQHPGFSAGGCFNFIDL